MANPTDPTSDAARAHDNLLDAAELVLARWKASDGETLAAGDEVDLAGVDEAMRRLATAISEQRPAVWSSDRVERREDAR